jgi:hypothetical protein
MGALGSCRPGVTWLNRELIPAQQEDGIKNVVRQWFVRAVTGRKRTDQFELRMRLGVSREELKRVIQVAQRRDCGVERDLLEDVIGSYFSL